MSSNKLSTGGPSHDMDGEITSAAMQRLLGVGKVALNDLAKRGIVQRGERRGTYLAGPSVASYCQHLREQAAAGRTPHGLRKAACRRLAEAGRTANEIAAVSGHRDWREIRNYTRKAEQRGMGQKALAGVADAFSGPENTADTFFGNPSGNLSGKRSQKP